MSHFQNIQKKLHQFTRKFYTNELIKGSILFLSLGFLYLFFILFIEYFLWLKPTARTVLFWIFILVELFLLIKFICIPIAKLIGFRKGISLEESSKIIGAHFPEVEDKLLNVLQLQENDNQSDLILASINQKSEALKPIPFTKAIDFKANTKYLKYAIIPILIFLISLFTGNSIKLGKSLERVVNHRTAYNPPAPFAFSLANQSLQVIQGESINVQFKTIGNIVPNECKIIFDDQSYYLKSEADATFSYTFSDVQKSTAFYVEANGVQSQFYQIKVIGTPTINNITLDLNYPNYVGKKNKTIQNSGNLIVPEGTTITWKANTNKTTNLTFITNAVRTAFDKVSNDNFQYQKRILLPINYQIASSNDNLKDFENLQFSVSVVKDDYPVISVSSNIDSISRGIAQFAGQISDDYGIRKLQLVYYDEDSPELKKEFLLDVSKQNIQTFFYQLPEGLNLQEGINYEMYFQVFDNDDVRGSKSSKSKVFNYRQKTKEEIEEELFQEQRNTINDLENAVQNQKEQQQQLEDIQEDLQNKKNINWNDKKKVESFIKRQEQYKKMMQRQTDQLQENLDEKKENDPDLQEKKQDLKERIKELKQLSKQKKLLEEIQKMADKLNKEDLVQKAKELAQQNKQQQRSLEKTLEMVKRFYVEQKTMQIANKVEELSKEQKELEQKENDLEAQKEISKQFDEIQKDLKELQNDNEKLKTPMDLPKVDKEENQIDEELKKSEELIQSKQSPKAKSSQKKAYEKMKEMSAKMQKSMMDMQSESIEENMDDLRKILENLVIFSFQQEQLMDKFSEGSTSHPDFGKDLKKQNEIRIYFEHIDDSLYVLAMRVPKISTKIQDDLSAAHYNLEQSLENFSENRFNNGLSNQQYVMTATNNLADYLSNILNSMQNNMSMKMGKGKKSDKPGFSLPDLIHKQKGLSEKMQKGMQKGEKKGEGKKGEKSDKNGKPGDKGKNGKKGEKGSSEGENGEGEGNTNDDLDGELYEIFKEQTQLRQELQDAIKESENSKPGGNGSEKKALKTMEQLENEILEKGFNTNTLKKMQNLNYELLKLDKAALEQGKDKKRKANTNKLESERNKARALKFKKQFYNQIEILNRQSLPLQQNYKKKVRAYFSNTKNN